MSGGLFGSRVPVILQSEAPECGIACLAMVASYYGHLTDLSAMRMRLSPSLKGVTLKHVSQVATKFLRFSQKSKISFVADSDPRL